MGIEEENGCWNQSNVKVVNVNLNLLRVHVNQCYYSKLGYVPRRSGPLLRHNESENFTDMQRHILNLWKWCERKASLAACIHTIILDKMWLKVLGVKLSLIRMCGTPCFFSFGLYRLTDANLEYRNKNLNDTSYGQNNRFAGFCIPSY